MIADRNRRQRRKPRRTGGGATCPSVATLGDYAGVDRLIAFQGGELNANEDGITGANWMDPVHDRVGNMPTIPEPANLAGGLTYNAFGEITDQTDPTVAHRFAFTGREWDEDAGLYYYRARWYDPELGRFLSEDPIGFAAGDTSLSRYVLNRPIDSVDPSGLWPSADAYVAAPSGGGVLGYRHPGIIGGGEVALPSLTPYCDGGVRLLPNHPSFDEGTFYGFFPFLGIKSSMQEVYGIPDVDHLTERGGYRMTEGGTEAGRFVPAIPADSLVGAKGAETCIILIITTPADPLGRRAAWAFHFGTKDNPSRTLRHEARRWSQGGRFPRGSKAVIAGGDDLENASMGLLFSVWTALIRHQITIEGAFSAPCLWVDRYGRYDSFGLTSRDDGTFPTPHQWAERLQKQ